MIARALQAVPHGESIVNRLIGVAVFDVLPNDRNRHVGGKNGRMADAFQHLPYQSVRSSGFADRRFNRSNDDFVQFVVAQTDGNFVNAQFLIAFLDHGFGFDVAKFERFFRVLLPAIRIRCANQNVGLNADSCAVRRRCVASVWFSVPPPLSDTARVSMNIQAIRLADIERELANCLEIGHAFKARLPDWATDDRNGQLHRIIGRPRVADI